MEKAWQPQLQTRTRMHTRTRTHTNAHALTHAHTHTLIEIRTDVNAVPRAGLSEKPKKARRTDSRLEAIALS